MATDRESSAKCEGHSLSYVLPLRWDDSSGDTDLTAYLREIAPAVRLIIVDGSEERIFEVHASLWDNVATVVRPMSWGGANGKVAGVMTGIFLATTDRVIIADDDVRYTRDSLAAVGEALVSADVVRPQNYFLDLPWHSRWDTARSLINRAFRSDFPGTLGVRRSVLLAAGGYSGEVLFENLELIRTILSVGGSERRLDDLFVGRVSPSSSHFISQRARQAYDSWAQPTRFALELALLPFIVLIARHRFWLMGLFVTSIGIAEVGRRRHKGTEVFGPSSSFWAPVWVVERAFCSWVAVGARLRGGAYYRGVRIPQAAHSLAYLLTARRAANRATSLC